MEISLDLLWVTILQSADKSYGKKTEIFKVKFLNIRKGKIGSIVLHRKMPLILGKCRKYYELEIRNGSNGKKVTVPCRRRTVAIWRSWLWGEDKYVLLHNVTLEDLF